MSSQGMNGLPGANAMGDTLEFMKSLWGAMKIPGISMPSMSPEEIDKQIADLKAVESWLQVNMNMLRSSIQALEVQSATLSALRSMGESFAQAAGHSSADQPGFESPFTQGTNGTRGTHGTGSANGEDSAAADDKAPSSGMPDAAAMAAQFANPAVWWNAVQEQFSNAVSQATQPARKPASKAKSGARKTAAKKSAATKSPTARKRTPKA